MKALVLKIFVIFLLFLPFSAHAFSVLTHEALIDANWDKTILPVLKLKYPDATEEALKKAKAFAYGGAVAPDMGYYPFGSKLFTNLVHYVRSGDFIKALLDEEKNVNEYAFALGFLCHYMADQYGHPMATNKSVPIVYPKVRKKFGNVVTYADDKVSHLRMEFGFDVLQTARGNYATAVYHNYIGFQVADSLMATAFMKTYGLDMKELFPNFQLALGTFRWTVKSLFPEITKAAWASRKKEIRKAQPGLSGRKFIYRMHRKDFVKEFGNKREKPGFLASTLSFLIRILPKVGPLKTLKFKIPGPEAEKLFVQSFDTVLGHYSYFVADGRPASHELADIDFDTGNKTFYGEYSLADQTYADLLEKLKDKHFENVTPELKNNIVTFFNHRMEKNIPEEQEKWKEIHATLVELKKAEPVIK